MRLIAVSALFLFACHGTVILALEVPGRDFKLGDTYIVDIGTSCDTFPSSFGTNPLCLAPRKSQNSSTDDVVGDLVGDPWTFQCWSPDIQASPWITENQIRSFCDNPPSSAVPIGKKAARTVVTEGKIVYLEWENRNKQDGW